MQTAGSLGVSHLPFVIAVMVAASYGFATPISYQTNLMVMGPGGYRLRDFLRVGLPLDIICGVVAITLIPIFFPLTPN
jgi:di/tricarboxylate transporter